MPNKNQYLVETSPILSEQVCPYCDKETEFVDSVEVHSESYGMIYLCRPCQAWVGVRKGTNIAPGRLANQELRLWKINAHESLDHLIREELVKYIYPKYISGISNREKTYFWIAEQLGIK